MKQLTKEQIIEAREFMDHKFRGSTIYEGHPIVVIDTIIANALDERFVTVPREMTQEMKNILSDMTNYEYGNPQDMWDAVIVSYKPPADGSE